MRDDGTPYLYGDGWFDDSGYFFGVMFTQEPGDPESLHEIRSNVGQRASRGVSYLKRVLTEVSQEDADSALQITQLHLAIGGLFMYDGMFDLAKQEFEAARKVDPDTSDLVQANYEALLGVVALRRGEVENCVACRNEESCIFPSLHVLRFTSVPADHVRRLHDLQLIWINVPRMLESSGYSTLPR